MSRASLLKNILLSLLYMLAAAGCGSKAAAPTVPATDSAVTQLQVLQPNVTGSPLEKVVNGYIAEFEQANPTISITPVPYRSYNETVPQIKRTLQGDGSPPTLALLDMTELYDLKDADAIVPLDECISRIGGQAYLDDFFPALLHNGQDGGHIWSVPYYATMPVLYLNQDALKEVGLDPKEPPTNWDELTVDAQKLTQRDAAGNVVRWGIQIPADVSLLQALAITAGQNLVGDDPTSVTFDRPAVVGALQFWLDLSAKYKAMPGNEISSRQAFASFSSAGTAMLIASSSNLGTLLGRVKFPLGVAFLPARKQFGAPVSGSALYILKKSTLAQQDAACKLIQFLTTPDKLADWSINSGSIATRKSAYDRPAWVRYTDKNPLALVVRDQVQFGQRDLLTYAQQKIRSTLNDKFVAVLRGTQTPLGAMTDAQQQADTILGAYR